MVPRLLTPEQKEIRMNIFADILQNIENVPDFFENVVTFDESWFFFNTTQKVSANPCTGRAPSSPRQKKARQSKSKFKAMMIFFSASEGLFMWIGCLKVRPLTGSTTRRF